MTKTLSIRLPAPSSDNQQSKTCTELSRSIENLKLVGCLAILLLLTGWVRMVEAQQTGKVLRIGYLDPSTASGSAVLLRRSVRRWPSGWTKEKNITIEYRFADRSLTPAELAADLVSLQVS